MMDVIDNNKFSEKLNEIFKENIKLSFVSELSVIIVTKEDKCYEFKRKNNKTLFIALSNNQSKIKALIEKSSVEELSHKQIIEIKSGKSHSIARTSEGQVYFWGRHGLKDESGETEKCKPELIQFLNGDIIKEMCCGCDHTLVLTENGVVYAWGGNHFGQIGNGMSHLLEYQLTPFRLNVFNGEKVEAISCGFFHSLALTENGHVYGWGGNHCGQLGIGNELSYSSPKLLELSKLLYIKRVSCGKHHSLLLTRDKDIYVCGWNWSKELRPWYHWIISTPIKLSYSEKFTDIASFFDHSISAAISEKSVLHIWGECGEVVITEPKITEMKSFDEIYEHYLKITYKSIDGKVIRFDDDFTNNGQYENNFIEIKEIAGGSYGKVFKVCEKNSSKKYAIKKIKFKLKYRAEFCLELETSSIVSEMKNEKIVKYFNVWLEKVDKKLILFIQMELCDKSLKEIIEEIKKDFNLFSSETLTPLGYYISIGIFIEILKGVKYLHKQNPPIIHRDLNPGNIMLKMENERKCSVKIIDLGLATIHEFKTQSHTKDKGNRSYMAPEVLTSRNYDETADIYSLGLILQQLFTIDVNREYNKENGNHSEFLFKYQMICNLCDRMIQTRIGQRPADIKKILKERILWNFNINESNYREEFEKVLVSSRSNKLFVFKLLKIKLLFQNESQSSTSYSSTDS